ncbi:uncharacterized protein PITG_12348 [Phytophthora infestans T30-4]|uniref:DUF4833 domain-containing protein n=1 Tax=Phytophthora infestans (strain T30-4) TaxID=403677 RepID=D0NKD2_PHYIT|nr:uncharacterized protein PITG_12348 [Phytophthora infestans T30-4]EEY60068.1 conserved hypothetical protein [Phytophthora infestans T30-4]|eukprot:XP_002900275.1 conserved hypothetical protein [Phytophthora infestans T30-4]
MSWLWGNETTEQAQFVVSALQSELDERESKIKALEAALKREQQDMTSLLEDEVKELEARRKTIEKELAGVDALIKEKQKLIQKSKSDGLKKKKKSKKSKTPVSQEETTKEEEGSESTEDAKVLPMDKNLKMVAKEEPNVAFIIQRSNNSNTVVYAACKSSNGKSLDPTTPIKVYWIMYEKDGNPREDLNMIERNTAYGVSSKPSDVPGEHLASVASLRDRDCVLRLDKHGNVMALTTINGKKGMILRRVFVQMTTSWGIPTVDHVDIFGVDPVTLEPVYEKKKNK